MPSAAPIPFESPPSSSDAGLEWERGRNSDVAVLVPMFNEAASVATVVHDLTQSFGTVVCIDDGSADTSAELARSAGATVLRHPFNMGQGAALQTGIDFVLRALESQLIVTFDADGQHEVSDAAAMVRMARCTGADLVLGSRFLNRDPSEIPLGRRVLLRAAAAFTRLTTGLPVTDTHNGLRVMSRPAASRIQLTIPSMGHASELLHQASSLRLQIAEHAVSIKYTPYSRAKGQSGLNAINIVHDLVARRVFGNL